MLLRLLAEVDFPKLAKSRQAESVGPLGGWLCAQPELGDDPRSALRQAQDELSGYRASRDAGTAVRRACRGAQEQPWALSQKLNSSDSFGLIFS